VQQPSRAAFACDPARGRGRLVAEPRSPTRTDYQRDRDRILHSAAFRRLSYKTQVFIYREGDHFRTRLTHSLEVSQIARSIARALGCEDDLAEALALAHDLGHTPFGHTGEEVLAECMAGHGGFDHNAQSLRIVTRLERRYAAFDGLNLTWETLEGLAKHNGPLIGARGGGRSKAGLPHAIRVIAEEIDLELDRFASLEAQIAAISDDIAYSNHDIDDGVRAGLFALDDLGEIALVRDVLDEVAALHGPLEAPRRAHETVRRLISRMVEDVLAETGRRLVEIAPAGPDDIRGAARAVAAFTPAMAASIVELRRFLFAHMYLHDRVRETRRTSGDVVRALFGHYLGDVERLPDEWKGGLAAGDRTQAARRVADFIAGMTDRFAIAEYERWFARTVDFG
jgi:dGTPase